MFACLGAIAVVLSLAAHFLLSDVVKRSKGHDKLDVASTILYALSFVVQAVIVAVGIGAGFVLLPRTRRSK
ncbi:hypothetical protein [uncultured Ellagibacter sp.]|uniref:hypothetical protein n=1 Tax=uncultured Ellagibacter sp. TaxID=2137580 RepID=UPI0026111874|nr:hypothetical protein [uncultured Ellagibacter sp.]